MLGHVTNLKIDTTESRKSGPDRPNFMQLPRSHRIAEIRKHNQ